VTERSPIDAFKDVLSGTARAITAEAKWSGNFLSGVPLLALVMINLIQPNYYDDVRETSYFIPACLVVGGFLIANIIVMRMLVNIKV